MRGGLGRRGDGRWCRFGGGCFQVLVPAYICQAKGNVCIIVSMSVLELKGERIGYFGAWILKSAICIGLMFTPLDTDHHIGVDVQWMVDCIFQQRLKRQ